MVDHEVQVLWVVKVAAALGSAMLAVIGCFLARRLEKSQSKGRAREMLLAFGNTLAAGILLAASLVHMLPDAMTALDGVTDFPLAPAAAGAAFCFLVVLGEVVGSCMPREEEPNTQTASVTYGASFALWPHRELMPPQCGGETPCPATSPPPGSFQAALPSAAAPAGQLPAGPSSHIVPQSSPDRHCDSLVLVHGDAALCSEPKAPTEQSHQAHGLHADHEEPASVAGRRTLLVDPLMAHGHGHGRGAEHHTDSSAAALPITGGPVAEVKSFFLFFALCFHSVMEGLGMGSAEGSGLLVSVILAVLAHKGLAAFALGCSLSQSDLPSWKFCTFVLIFSLGTPIGCASGMALSSVGSSAGQGEFSGICTALSSGTFLQVASMELLPRVLAEQKHKSLACIGLALGFAAMSVLAIWC